MKKFAWSRSVAAVIAVGFSVGAADYDWELAGPGGGGRFIWPAVAPEGGQLMCASDMGAGFYGSTADGEMTFIRQQEFSFSASYGFFFQPGKPGVVYAAAGLKGAVKSSDSGRSWQAVPLPIEKLEWNGSWPTPYSGPMTVAFSPENPARGILAYFKHGKKGRNPIFTTADGGETWQLDRLFPEDSPKFVGSAFSVSGEMLQATEAGVFRLDKTGSTAVFQPPQGGKIVAFRRAGSRYYIAVNTPEGAAISIADGEPENWRTVDMKANKAKITFLAVSGANPDIAYFIMPIPGNTVTPDEVFGSTVFKTVDGFRSWEPVLFRNRESKRFNVENPQWTSDAWGWQTAPRGLSVCDTDPDIVAATDQTQFYLSKNGGKTWRLLASRTEDGGKTTQASGMAIMSAYGYYFAPGNRDHRYIAMNDFSNWASFDGGKSWAQYNDGNPFAHNVYTALFDDKTPGKLWVGTGKDHDLPHWKWQNSNQKLTNQGGLTLSLDGGKSWKQMGNGSGLPAGNITGIVQEPDSRDLIVAVYGKGVYRSSDDGRSWQDSSEGLSKWDRSVYQLKYDPAGRLWLVTSVRKPGNVYRSADGGRSWKKIFSDGKFPYLTGIAFDPADADTVYLSAFSTRPFHDSDGGIRQSTDGGKSWRTIFPGRACWSVAVHPKKPQTLFACTYADGLFLTTDGGKNWRMLEAYPAPSPVSVTFDPQDPDTVYVSNFGGSVYRGTVK